MAETVRRFEFNTVERLWLMQALQRLEVSLERARKKETLGSEVAAIRAREIALCADLRRRLT